MKRTVGRPRRSTSRKPRRHTPSSHTPSPDDYIVQVLNERSISDRDILITRQQYENLKQCRQDLKAAQAALERQRLELEHLQKDAADKDTLCDRLRAMVETLEERRQVDSRHLQELTAMNGKLTAELKDAQWQNSEQHKESQVAVNKLRAALADVHSVMEHRAAAGHRELSKCLKALTQELAPLLESTPYFSSKPQISGLVQTAVGYVEGVRRLLTSKGQADTDSDLERTRLQEEVQRLRESSSSTHEYIAALEKMKEQTRLIKERLKLVEGEFPYKKAVDDYEGRIQLLTSEKEMLSEHVKTLQATLSEQCSVIEHLKGIIASLANTPEPRSLRVSPVIQSRSPDSSLLSPDRKTYSPLSRSVDINQEIEALDRDIQTLQTSLQRALQHH